MFRRTLAGRLNAGASRRVRRGDPWVYADSVQMRQQGEAGDLAVLYDTRNRFAGIGLYDPHSDLRVRVLSREQQPIDSNWLTRAICAALDLRQPLFDTADGERPTTGFRLLHGENDGLPGLVVDRYANCLVVRLDTAAWIPHLEIVTRVLGDLLAQRGVVVAAVALRLSRKTAAVAGIGVADGQWLSGRADEVQFLEHGLKFVARPNQGQKTGFFLDQRDNRQRVERLVQQRQCRRVLNTFAYSGGFSLYAARGGAVEVCSVDLAAAALADAEQHFELNDRWAGVATCAHSTYAADVFTFLEQCRGRGQVFDLVILDPPAFAQKQADVVGAVAAYQRLAQAGAHVVARGGMLLAASCSSRINNETFAGAVEHGVRAAGRTTRLVGAHGHALDHPVGFNFGAYLKSGIYELA